MYRWTFTPRKHPAWFVHQGSLITKTLYPWAIQWASSRDLWSKVSSGRQDRMMSMADLSSLGANELMTIISHCNQYDSWLNWIKTHHIWTGKVLTWPSICNQDFFFNAPDKVISVAIIRDLFLLFLQQNIHCVCSLELSRWDDSNEYPYNLFLCMCKTNIFIIYLLSILKMKALTRINRHLCYSGLFLFCIWHFLKDGLHIIVS